MHIIFRCVQNSAVLLLIPKVTQASSRRTIQNPRSAVVNQPLQTRRGALARISYFDNSCGNLMPDRDEEAVLFSRLTIVFIATSEKEAVDTVNSRIICYYWPIVHINEPNPNGDKVMQVFRCKKHVNIKETAGK